MFRTLRILQKYTVTVYNSSGQGQPNTAIGNLKFKSGGADRNQFILNLPQTYPNNTPQKLFEDPDAGSTITWETQTQLLFTQPLTATIFHATNLTQNLNVFITTGAPYANLALVETEK
jgi:hypothetical protein